MRAGMLVALLASAAACGSSGPSATAACTERAQASCALRDSCSASHGVAAHYGDMATCVSREAQQCELNLKAPGVTSTPSTVAACAAALPATACEDFWNNVPVAACVPPAGKRASGEACGGNAQCQSTYCAVPVGSACGQCADLPSEGAPCVDPGGVVRGFVCSRTSGTWAALAASGGPCGADLPCGTGLACVGTPGDGGMASSCQPQGTSVGVACDTRLESAPDCDRTLGVVCTAHRNGTCVALGYVGAGQQCGRQPGTVDGGTPVIDACTGGALCAVGAAGDGGVATGGTCVAPAAEGQACDTAVGPPCLGPARCIGTVADGGTTSGTCQLVDPSTCN